MTNYNYAGYKILIVEDDTAERSGMARMIADHGYQVATADSADKALSYLNDNESVDFVLTDLQMGDVSGMDLLKHWKLKSPETMFLMITGHGSTQTAIDAIKAGAYDYMPKPIDPNKLFILLQNMVRQKEESRKVAILQNRLDERFSLSSIIGRSAGMQRVFELIRRSSQAMSTVLILGESGTGKELVAQAIHQNSPRRDGPFIAVNCAAMAPTLVESELFGHEKGSFTGADQKRIGRFEAASGGTLFIDEIGDFDVSLQVKLLRVLEAKVVTPVGGHKEIKTDTRVLAATSRDIREMMLHGKFREDLYYRLNVIQIELPPLRTRPEDIPLLVRKFMDRVNEQNGTKITSIDPAVIDVLQQYNWPGNVRELLNVIERMMVLTDKPALEVEDLPAYIRQGPSGRSVGITGAAGMGTELSASMGGLAGSGVGSAKVAGGLAPAGTGAGVAVAAPANLDQALATMTLAELEDRAIVAALQRFNNNRTRAARALGISVRTLQRKLGAKNGGVEEGSEGEGGSGAPSPAGGPPDSVGAGAEGF